MATTGVLRLTDQHEQLLPGIPDEITLNKICTKLPWRAVYVLSLVSPGWRRATRSRQVYEARVRSQSTETLVVFSRHVSSKLCEFYLYSSQDKACYQLPWLSQLLGGPWFCKCVSLDGKIYAMRQLTDKMFVLDVAGHWGWRHIADIQARRAGFGCGVMDGKLYVVGRTSGVSDGEDLASGSEVYDPDTNVWSSIPPVKSERSNYDVVAMGEKLYVPGRHGRTRGAHYMSDVRCASLDIYHPTKNEWRHIESWSTFKLEQLFISHGKFYGVRTDGIYVHDDDIEKNSWKIVHLFKDGFLRQFPPLLVAVGDEVLDFSFYPGYVTDGRDLCLRQSKGFASTTKELVWETVRCCASKYSGISRRFMCTVEL